MKRELKNVRIVADNGKTVLISKKRYNCLLQTLELLASGAYVRRTSRAGMEKTIAGGE